MLLQNVINKFSIIANYKQSMCVVNFIINSLIIFKLFNNSTGSIRSISHQAPRNLYNRKQLLIFIASWATYKTLLNLKILDQKHCIILLRCRVTDNVIDDEKKIPYIAVRKRQVFCMSPLLKIIFL